MTPLTTRTPPRTHTCRRAARGQSLVEFAIVLPVFLALTLGAFQLAIGFATLMRLQAVADSSARIAASYGGETATGDAEIADLARRNDLNPAQLTMQVSTRDGSGTVHLASDPPGTPPPPAPYGGRVTVTFRYSLPLVLPFPGDAVWSLPASGTDSAPAAYGDLAP